MSSSACLSGLEMGVDKFALKNRRKTRFVDHLFLPEDKNKMQLSLSCRAREVAGEIFLTDFSDVIKV